MNDITTVVIEHRNAADEVLEKSEEFDVNRNSSWVIADHIKTFINGTSVFPTDCIVVQEINKEEDNA